MPYRTTRALLYVCAMHLFLALFFLFTSVASQGLFPCHPDKHVQGVGVTCEHVQLPPLLCDACPLKPVHADGQFVRCDDTFDVSATGCMPELQKYVAANKQCDPIRTNAITQLAAAGADPYVPSMKAQRKIVDYFLYSVCEQCCDCVPMGSKKELYNSYSAAHTPQNPVLYKADRGNCPAHAVYDVCMIFPKIVSFLHVGEKPDAAALARGHACPRLRAWKASPNAYNWQSNPKTTIVPQVRAFLDNMLQKSSCAKKSIWSACWDMENRQKHLLVPGCDKCSPSDAPTDKEDTPTPAPNPTKSTNLTPSSSLPAATGAPGTSKTSDPASTPSANESGAPDASGKPNPNSQSGASGAGGSSSGPACFPGHAKVTTRRGVVEMRALRIGDDVLSDDNAHYSRVYAFSHRDAQAVTNMVRIETSLAQQLVLSPGHLLSADGKLTQAQFVKVGAKLRTVHGIAFATRVEQSLFQKGLFNPHTISGNIVVENVLVSTYTDAVPPRAAEALLAPLRVLAKLGLAHIVHFAKFLDTQNALTSFAASCFAQSSAPTHL